MRTSEGMRVAARALMTILVTVLVLAPFGGVAARVVRHRPHHLRVVPPPPTPPSQDAIELATLSPPSRLSTIEQTYGDAVYARHRLESRIDRQAEADLDTAAAYGGVPIPCEPRIAGASAYACNGAPHPRSYGQGYAFTPSYLSAPQRLGVPPDEQTQVLPPFTGLAWVVNSLRPDAHN